MIAVLCPKFSDLYDLQMSIIQQFFIDSIKLNFGIKKRLNINDFLWQT